MLTDSPPRLPGFVIYFCYGIHHSAEAALARSSPKREMIRFMPSHSQEDEAMSPEKEAFLHKDKEATEEDDGDF